MSKKLVVLSYDALQSGDLKLLSGLPYFSQILKSAAIINNIREIYPTLTYPIHTSIVTGVYPDKHGITHNQKASISPDAPDFSIMGSDWYWQEENIKVRTLQDAVWERGGTVSSVLWPVTAGDERGYNLPEIWPVKEKNEDARAVYEKASSKIVMENYYDRFISHYDWSSNEDMVHYGVEIALDILLRQKPDLFLCHLVHLDHIRHVYGDQGPMIDDCLKQLDIIAGRFIQAAEDAGILEETNFIILGDHGQIDIEVAFNLNVELMNMGFISVDKGGDPIGYEAYSFSSGFSTQIMLTNNDDNDLRNRVYDALLQIQKKYPQYIERVYTACEVEEEEHLEGDFSFVVEGTKGTLFLNDIDSPLIVPSNSKEYKAHRAMHGHHPNKGEKPPFIAFGPDIIPGIRLDYGDMIDICPTLALLAEVEMPAAAGKAFPIIKNNY